VWENHLKTDNFKKTCIFFSNHNYSTYLINEVFPYCREDCRNFISIPNNNLINQEIKNINTFFNELTITKNNKADIKKDFLIYLIYLNYL
jgi:hypothetical protein